MDGLVEMVRRESQHVYDSQHFKSTLVVTGYNPQTHSVKGILVPHGVETGWIPIGSSHIGNGFGILIGPKVGDPQKLDGDQFNIEFEGGNPDTPIATHRLFSAPDAPPVVQSGEILLRHEDGASIFFDQKKALTLTGSKSQTVVMDADGGITATDSKGAKWILKDGNATLIDKDGGIVYCSGGKVMLGDKSASAHVMTDAGPSPNVFAKA